MNQDGDSGSASSGECACPECGRTFARPQALGAHRRQAHGVVGSSKQARSRSGRRRRANTAAAAKTRSGASGRRGLANDSRPARKQVNRDALLQALFPNGIPAREDVIRSVNSWLDEAERLARLR